MKRNHASLRSLFCGVVALGIVAVSGPALSAEYGQTHDSLDLTVGFPGWGFDTDWVGVDLGLVAAYVRLAGGLGGTVLDIELNGDAALSYPSSPDHGDLWFEGSAGSAEQNLGIELSGQYKVVVGGFEYIGDLPYVPQTDLRLEDAETFTPYMLGESVTLEDHIDQQELFTIPIGAAGIFAGEVGVSLTAGNEFVLDFNSLNTDQAVYTEDGEHAEIPVSGAELTVGDIHEMVGLSPTLTLLPNVVFGITVGPFHYDIDIPTITIDVPLESLLEDEYPTTPPRSVTFLLLPVVTSFAVNNDAPETMGRVVVLNNACPNEPTQYMASEDPLFDGASWIPYDDDPQFLLSPGDGVKEVFFKVQNVHGDSPTVSDTITLDTTRPTVDFLATTDTTPPLTGTVHYSTASVSVTVDGQTHAGTNHGDGTWSLPDNTLTGLSEGVYDVAVTVTDGVGNTLEDTTTDELAIDLTDPTVTVDFLRTNDQTPQLSGTVDDEIGVAGVQVTVDGHTYTAGVAGGVWTADVSYALAEGTYDVQAVATDLAARTGNDATTDELVIDFSAIMVTVDFLATTDSTPPLTGEVDELTASISVTVHATPPQTFPGTNHGNGTWSLADDTLSPLPEGVYDVEVTASAMGGRTGEDQTTDELAIDMTDPSVTVDRLTTNDPTPQLTGTAEDAVGVSTVRVTVDGHDYWAAVEDGVWRADITNALDDGEYDVAAVVTDLAGNTANDGTHMELIVDTDVPSVTVDFIHTHDTTPAITGTVDDSFAVVWVTVGTQTHKALNWYGNEFWTLPDDRLSALEEGVYNVEVRAVDAAGNEGFDPTTDELAVDLTPPGATITLADPSPTGRDAVDFEVVFDEAVGASFTTEDVTLLPGSLAGMAAAVDGADPSYTVTVVLTDPDADGTVAIAVGTAVTDLAGNPFGGGSSEPYTIHNWSGFTVQPEGARRYAGDTHTLVVAANEGVSTQTYAWKWDDGSKAIHDLGVLSPTCALEDLTTGHAGAYWCEVAYDGETYDSAHVTLAVAEHVAIVQHPAGGAHDAGSGYTFTVLASGGYPPLHYTWKKDGVPVTGATGSIYAIPVLHRHHEGSYTVEVADDHVDATESYPAFLAVNAVLPAAGLAGLAVLVAAGMLLGAIRVRTIERR